MKYLYTFIFIITFSQIYSQESHGGIPYTFMVNSSNASLPNYRQINPTIPTIELPFLDNNNLKLIADTISGNCIECKNKFYGKVLNYSVDVVLNASYQLIDSVKIWRYAAYNSSAEGLQFYFSKFQIPQGGELYFYNSDKTYVFGHFSAENNPIDSLATIQFGTVPLYGDTIIMEYNQPVTVNDLPVLELVNIVHVFDSKFVKQTLTTNERIQSESCEIDVNCTEGYGWESERNSTVMIMYNNGSWAGICTGNMLNNTLYNEAPYLLTAGHCLKTLNSTYWTSASSLLFLFNHQTSCNYGTTVAPNTLYSVFGAIDLSTENSGTGNVYYDYSLLQLNASKETLRKWNVCFAGWNRTTDELTDMEMPLTMIHHPMGDVKKISISEIELPLISAIHTSDPFPNPNKPFYKIFWADGKGMAEHGSSGAAIFDYFHRLRGNLIGVSDVDDCTTPYRKSMMSKFFSSWTHGGFDFWLSPNNPNALMVNTFCPNTNTDPTGTGGGGYSGDCDPKTIAFKINGHMTYSPLKTIVTNVCKDNVWISPYSGCPPNRSPNAIWYYKKKTSDTWCSNISDRWAAAYETTSWFGLKCHCEFYMLFLAIQECDHNLNLIGPEYSKWYYIFDGDKGGTAEYLGFKDFNFNGYFSPQGYVLEDGKYYKIKIASYLDHPGWWSEYSAYIKTFTTGNNIIQNEILTRNEVGANVTIINSVVPFSAGSVKVAAENKIKIQYNTKLETGRYFIQDIDCNNINQFRTNNTDTTYRQEGNGKNYSNIKSDNGKQVDKTVFKDKFNIELEIVPNPANISSSLKFELKKKASVSSELFDINGRLLYNVITPMDLENGVYDIKISTSSLTNGIYVIKTTINNKLYINKLIVNHD